MRHFIFLILFLFPALCYSQQEPEFIMFWNNYSLFNPANTGAEYKHYGSVVRRFGGRTSSNDFNLSSLTTNYEIKLEKLNSGLGVGYMHDWLYPNNNNRIYLNYAFHHPFDFGTLSLGASAIYSHIKFDISTIPVIDHTDPVYLSLVNNPPFQGKFLLNFGALFKTEKLSIGLSGTRINEPFYNEFSYNSAMHLYTFLSYTFTLSELVDWKVNTLFKTEFNTVDLDVNNLFIFNKKYWFGITIQTTEQLGGHLGIDIKEKFRIGYSFDYPFGATPDPLVSGSHELVLGVLFK